MPFYDVLVEIVHDGDGEAARHALRIAFNAMDHDWLSRHGYHPGEAKPAPEAG